MSGRLREHREMIIAGMTGTTATTVVNRIQRG